MIDSTVRALIQMMAGRLGVRPDDLMNLIKFESGFNPKAKNPYSSARGLIQFTDSTAKRLGYKSSKDLVKKNPSVKDQLPLVERYLSWYKPFTGKQSLYMAVFYPKARYWNKNKNFPANVRKVNPGISNPGDYVSKVEGGKVATFVLLPLVAGSLILYYVLKKKGKRSEKEN